MVFPGMMRAPERRSRARRAAAAAWHTVATAWSWLHQPVLLPPTPAGRAGGFCDHKHWDLKKHGRRCTCGAWMFDPGD
jgi:hypothetical protein